MYQSIKRIKAVSSLEIFATVGLSLGLSSWALGQDCGAGDVTSSEACLVDGNTDNTNGGCNSDPAVFENAVINGSISGTVSTYNSGGDNRDTDWYLLSPAQLAAADTDNNGIVVLSHNGSSEAPVQLFIVAIGDTPCGEGEAAVIGTTGSAGPDCASGDPSLAVIDIADHPNGIAYWIGTGDSGGPIFTGWSCSTNSNDYLINLEVFEYPEACTFEGEPCNVVTNEPGCNDPECCNLVCEIDSGCCEVSWDQLCADQAIENGCALGLGAPSFIATGPDSGVDGYLDLFVDGFGSASQAAGGPLWIDHFNPVGHPLGNPTWANTTMLFTGAADRVALSLHEGTVFYYSDSTMTTTFVDPNVLSDQNKDGVDDQIVSHFIVSGALELDIILTQNVETSIAEGGTPYANWTVSYEITNTGSAATFDILRWTDADILYGSNDWEDDTVGTGTNGGSECNRYLYQGEVGDPSASLTSSTNQPNALYVGSKRFYDLDCDGPVPPFDFGIDPDPVWSNNGLRPEYANYVAGVGTDIDGESGAAPNDGCDPPNTGADGSMGIQSSITLGANETTTVVFMLTYGAITPSAAVCDTGSCVWDLDDNGAVGTGDLLTLFSQWGTDGPADFDGSGTVGTGDLLILFSNWGDCP